MCNPSRPPAWQQGAGISLLPEFSSVQLTLFLQLNVGDMHLIPAAPRGSECLSPTAPHGRYALWPCRSPLESHLCPAAGPGRHAARGHTDVHPAGATVARRGTVWALFEVTCRVAPLPHGCSRRRGHCLVHSRQGVHYQWDPQCRLRCVAGYGPCDSKGWW